MARQTSFGEMLRQARERKGIELSTASRRLRIRPDILRAIEDGDFARMPPRGYTSNMVGAYARLVGLNSAEMTRLYREEASYYETGRRPADSRYDRSRGSDRGYDRSGRSTRRGDLTDGFPTRSPRSSRSSERQRGGAAPQPQYTNLVQGRQAPGVVASLGSLLPLIIVGLIIVGLLVLVIVLAFGGDRGGSGDDTPSIPISGMPNPAGTDSSGTTADTTEPDPAATAPAPTPARVAPSSVVFTYNVESGKTAYIEVVEDGKTTEAGNVTGPATKEVDVTGVLRFVYSGDPENVTVTVDGEEVELEESTKSRGVYIYTLDFQQFLADWQKANGVSSSDSSDDATDDGSDDSKDDGSSTKKKSSSKKNSSDDSSSDDTQ